MRRTMASFVQRENYCRGNRRRRYPTSDKHIEQREPSAACFDACAEYAACLNATIVRTSHAGAAPSQAHRSKGKRESLRGRKTVGLSVLSDSYLFRKRKIIDKPAGTSSQSVSQTKIKGSPTHNDIICDTFRRS
ncbi:MAG: hypothetical protein WCQ72_01200 [Eubacteriales bacterium]